MSGRELDGTAARLVARYVDGELEATERTAFEQKMIGEPKLRSAVDELRGLRAMFAAEGKAPAPSPSPGFAGRVLQDVRRLPTAADLRAADSGAQAQFEQTCRRIVIAAALLIGIGLLAFAGLLRKADSGMLQASPVEIRSEMERLDGLIRARADGNR